MQRVVDRVLARGRGGTIEQAKEADEHIWKQLGKDRILNRNFLILFLGSFVMLQGVRLKLARGQYPLPPLLRGRGAVPLTIGFINVGVATGAWYYMIRQFTNKKDKKRGGGGARKQYTGRLIWRPSRDAQSTPCRSRSITATGTSLLSAEEGLAEHCVVEGVYKLGIAVRPLFVLQLWTARRDLFLPQLEEPSTRDYSTANVLVVSTRM